jgi:hypothetical protein
MQHAAECVSLFRSLACCLVAPSTSSYFILVPGGLINVRLWPKGKTPLVTCCSLRQAAIVAKCYYHHHSLLLLLDLKNERGVWWLVKKTLRARFGHITFDGCGDADERNQCAGALFWCRRKWFVMIRARWPLKVLGLLNLVACISLIMKTMSVHFWHDFWLGTNQYLILLVQLKKTPTNNRTRVYTKIWSA